MIRITRFRKRTYLVQFRPLTWRAAERAAGHLVMGLLLALVLSAFTL